MIITCEHGGNIVPELYQNLFAGHDELLQSHRGWDKGALDVAKFISQELKVPLYYSEVTRLLIEANRSLTSQQLYSDITSVLPGDLREEIKRSHYVPYRSRVEQAVRDAVKPVNHFSIHSFTPVWFEEVRRTDIGILFDPSRAGESALAEAMRSSMHEELPALRVDFNEPYKGIDDGFASYLRSLLPEHEYRGIEIEINQRFADSAEWEAIKHALCRVFRRIA